MKYKHNRYPDKWLQLYLLNNCFGSNSGQHLGLEWEGDWYCITHNSNNEKLLIEKKFLSMRNISPKKEYLKRIYDSDPSISNPTNMSIAIAVLNKYIDKHGRRGNKKVSK